MGSTDVTRRTVLGGIGAATGTLAALALWPRAYAGEPVGDPHAYEHGAFPHVGRAGALVEASAAPQDSGVWGAPVQGPFPLTAIHATLLHTGKVLMVDKLGAYLWDPVGTDHRRIDPPNIVYCSGHTTLADGDVYFSGGVNKRGARGPLWNYVFDVAGSRWVRTPDSRRGRYYPTVCLLGDGRVVITSGKLEDGATLNPDVEVYADGRLDLVASRTLRMYPHMLLMPDSRILVADASAKSVVLDPDGWTWTSPGKMLARRTAAAGVVVPSGPGGSTRVLVTGGHQKSSHPTTEIYDTASPGWRPRASLPEGRSHMNLVILPDGTMLGVGGTNGDTVATKRTMLYDPAADTWTGLATQTEERGYHSTALLLPDGRVLSAGDNFAPGGGSKLEIYQPPYLFRGPRPVITSVPSSTTWGARLPVETPSDVARAVLIRPSSVTHTSDMAQRHIELAFSSRSGGIDATAPPTPSVATPGWYMLFVLDAAGVPSVASWVRLGP